MPDRVVTAEGPNHVWHLDLTTVPIVSGFWASWLPFALPQCWPFCWWVAVAIDHYSRRLVSVVTFPTKPDSRAICRFLESGIRSAGATPNYLICDKDRIFWCKTFRSWCRRKRSVCRAGIAIDPTWSGVALITVPSPNLPNKGCATFILLSSQE